MKLSYRNERNAEIIAKFWGKPLDRPDWYRIEAKAADEAEIIIYDVVGWPFIMADEFVRELAEIKTKRITVRINSPGGDVFDGSAIYNSLKDHPAEIVTRVEGLAASVASIIMLSGDQVQAHANSMIMIHAAWAIALGNQYELRDIADILQQIDENMLDIYYAKSSIGKRELKQMMKETTWFKAKEAKARNLIDMVIDEAPADATARFDLSIFDHVPADMMGRPHGRELTRREIERALRDAGASRNFALKVAAGYSDIDEPLRDAGEDDIHESLMKLVATIGG